ncbi:endocuticle structural protein SgAbd-6-like isoform X2 [Schistocerca gregaria]|uniref:endocuticle structural protein SgAbd-6-like isoform X2 n=1 Tax=Schistocerca gregaria TaxID=7010 RepID=UPI00211F285D|nr:endocuticle structural protein SgAbd-6-like isoform X2 [Schistocerca gregaria]
MKLVLVLCALVSAAAGQGRKPSDAVILEMSHENDGMGQYSYGFKTSDGLVRQEESVLKNPGTKDEAIQMRGIITWKDENGREYKISYVADENGFHPEYNL